HLTDLLTGDKPVVYTVPTPANPPPGNPAVTEDQLWAAAQRGSGSVNANQRKAANFLVKRLGEVKARELLTSVTTAVENAKQAGHNAVPIILTDEQALASVKVTEWEGNRRDFLRKGKNVVYALAAADIVISLVALGVGGIGKWNTAGQADKADREAANVPP